MSSWLEHTDQDWDENHEKQEYTWKVYTGEYADKKHVKDFLVKRAYWEKNDAWKLRIDGADPDLSLFTLITSIAGQSYATEDEDKLTFDDQGFEDLINNLWEDIDGEGTNFDVFWKKHANLQLVFQEVYILVDGVKDVPVYDEEGNEAGTVTQEATIKIIFPQHVLDKGDGWIKVKHVVEKKENRYWTDKCETEDQYTIYHEGGWQRWRITEGGEELIDEDMYEFWTDEKKESKRLPIFRVKLPFPMYIAYYLARKVIVIFNQESCVDTYVGEGTITHLIEDTDAIQHEAIKDDIQAGETHHNIEGKAYYINPSAEPAQMAREHIKDKRKNLALQALQQYGEAAKEATATEIRYKSMSGREAFLNLFVSTREEAINEALFLLAQVYFPNDTSKWRSARMTLSRKFQVIDPMQLVSMIMEIVFGQNAIPITEEMELEAIKFIWQSHLGFTISEEQEAQLKEAVGLHMDEKHGAARRLPIGGDGAIEEPEPVFKEL